MSFAGKDAPNPLMKYAKDDARTESRVQRLVEPIKIEEMKEVTFKNFKKLECDVSDEEEERDPKYFLSGKYRNLNAITRKKSFMNFDDGHTPHFSTK